MMSTGPSAVAVKLKASACRALLLSPVGEHVPMPSAGGSSPDSVGAAAAGAASASSRD